MVAVDERLIYQTVYTATLDAMREHNQQQPAETVPAGFTAAVRELVKGCYDEYVCCRLCGVQADEDWHKPDCPLARVEAMLPKEADNG